jgi:hypothetical protein
LRKPCDWGEVSSKATKSRLFFLLLYLGVCVAKIQWQRKLEEEIRFFQSAITPGGVSPSRMPSRNWSRHVRK